MEEFNFKESIECPICHSKEVSQTSESGVCYQCKMCSCKFRNTGEPFKKERDFDFPSPEDHDL